MQVFSAEGRGKFSQKSLLEKWLVFVENVQQMRGINPAKLRKYEGGAISQEFKLSFESLLKRKHIRSVINLQSDINQHTLFICARGFECTLSSVRAWNEGTCAKLCGNQWWRYV